MKAKSYKMAIIPFSAVPHRSIFRWNKEWWERIIGSTNEAEQYIEGSSQSRVTLRLPDKQLVAIPRIKLERPLQVAAIVEEFNLCVKLKNSQ